MARINIEESFWFDPRVKSLTFLLQDEGKAIGEVIRFWRLAQEFWRQDRSLIPYEIFELSKFPVQLIEVGIAQKKEAGIYCLDSEKYFDWLVIRAENGKLGGEKSAESRRSKINNLGEANASKRKQTEPSTSTSFSKEYITNKARSNERPYESESFLKNELQVAKESLDLEKLYSIYPSRPNMKKKLGMERLAKIVKSKNDFEKMELAIKNYAAYINNQKTKQKFSKNFIKQFPTFISEWDEWVANEAKREVVFEFKYD